MRSANCARPTASIFGNSPTKTRSSSLMEAATRIRDKTIGRVKYPIFKVVGWVKKNGLDDAGNGADRAAEVAAVRHEAAGAAAKPATTHKPAAQPHF